MKYFQAIFCVLKLTTAGYLLYGRNKMATLDL